MYRNSVFQNSVPEQCFFFFSSTGQSASQMQTNPLQPPWVLQNIIIIYGAWLGYSTAQMQKKKGKHFKIRMHYPAIIFAQFSGYNRPL